MSHEPTICGTLCKYFHHINVNIYRYSIIVSLFCSGSLWLQCYSLSAAYPSPAGILPILFIEPLHPYHAMIHCGDICCGASSQAPSTPTAHHFLKSHLSCTTAPSHKPYSGSQALFLYSTTVTSAPSLCIS